MALFSMRDSWNVWRRKVNTALGGLAEPIKSKDVTYDNTDSGLTATNVQSAIDEVADSISDLPLNNKYLYEGMVTAVTVTGSADKTFQALLNELVTSFNTYLDTLETNQYVNVKRVMGNYTLIPMNNNTLYSKATPMGGMQFMGSSFSDNWGSQIIHAVRTSPTLENNIWLATTLKATPTFVAAWTALNTTGVTFTLICDVYTKA